MSYASPCPPAADRLHPTTGRLSTDQSLHGCLVTSAVCSGFRASAASQRFKRRRQEAMQISQSRVGAVQSSPSVSHQSRATPCMNAAEHLCVRESVSKASITRRSVKSTSYKMTTTSLFFPRCISLTCRVMAWKGCYEILRDVESGNQLIRHESSLAHQLTLQRLVLHKLVTIRPLEVNDFAR